MDIAKAVKFLDAHAEARPTHYCARYVRKALQAGGLNLTPPYREFAKDYGPVLLSSGLYKYYEFKHMMKGTHESRVFADSAVFDFVSDWFIDRDEFKGVINLPVAVAPLTRHYTPEAGDVAVIQPYPGGDSAGHIAMYDGKNWVSDFKQRDMWGGPGYRAYKPDCVIYRP